MPRAAGFPLLQHSINPVIHFFSRACLSLSVLHCRWAEPVHNGTMNFMRSGFGFVAGCWAIAAALASQPQTGSALESKDRVALAVTPAAEPFPLEDVRLLDGPFKHAMDLDHRYWDTLTPAQWDAKLEARRKQKELEARIAARTVDRVLPANEASEQQHHVQGDNTRTGEQRWRHAVGGGWFSWDLKVLPGQTQELRVKYCGDDTGGREFDLLVDGQKLATQTLDKNRPGEFYEESYQIPAAWVQGKHKVVIRFQAHPGKTAGGVFGCAMVGPELLLEQ